MATAPHPHPGPLAGPILLQRAGVSSRLDEVLRERARLTDDALAELDGFLAELAQEVGERLEAMLDGAPIGDTATEGAFVGLKEGAAVKAQVLATHWEGFARIIEDAGMPAARERWFDRYGDLAVQAERAMAAQGFPRADTLLDSEAVAEGIAALQRRHDDALFGKFTRLSAERITDALHTQVGLKSHKEIAREIVEQEDLTRPQAMAEAETRVAEADRYFTAVAAEQASEGEADFVYAYAGPVDAKTRPFCSKIVGKAFDLDQIERLRNGQTSSPPFLSGGGYRCRHLWVPVLPALLDALPYSTGTDADISAANAAAGTRGKKAGK
ncbi:MAG: hypothetical protein EKK55_16345 [Rhodocyclaceae bacterium]|nr:MAG: hypothetical protein EKK55_16345 [Rhodocyclaceae bacterium]